MVGIELQSHLIPCGRTELWRNDAHLLNVGHCIIISEGTAPRKMSFDLLFHSSGLGCEDYWANPWNVQAEELGSSSARDLSPVETFVKRI